MRPHELVGLPYRLGASPERHGATDCVGLARCVLAAYGITTPQPTRDWYRRLRQGDTSIFREQLQLWGKQVAEPRLGAVALCRGDHGYGLAVWWQDGWLSYRTDQVCWSPQAMLPVQEIYCPTNCSCVSLSG